LGRLLLAIFLGAALAVGIGWLWFGGWTRQAQPANPSSAAPSAAAATSASTGEDTRRIRVTLYIVAENGAHLVGVDREVPYAESPVDQARRLMEALLAPVQGPLLPPVPAGTTLRTLFLTETGEAYVDFSPEISKNHPGGSLDEILTVYAIVNTLTVNLPAITRVQILVDGKEVDTLAGHVDLRHPLEKNLKWVKTEKED
jgi:spore germination protein GerM